MRYPALLASLLRAPITAAAAKVGPFSDLAVFSDGNSNGGNATALAAFAALGAPGARRRSPA